jgi:PAS domain S-box-containing protein
MPFDPSNFPQAFENDEFFPVFQPMVELRTGQLAGFEVLARWRHPRFGLIAPDEFIPFLERSGQIDGLTEVILAKTFAAPALARTTAAISVNLSSIQLLDEALPQRISDAAAQGGFALERLTLEITESALLDDLARAKRVAEKLKDLKCSLALDDFGTGYSSLRHLNALPFDQLKVDRGFVGTMTRQRESRKIVASIIGLGQSLGLVTVAEGVETSEQADMLLWTGCDLAQGWLYGKPVGCDDLGELVTREWPRAAIPAGVSLNCNSLMSEATPGQRLAQLQAIYDGAPVGLCLLDNNLRYVSLNRMLARMNGVPAEAHLGRTPADVVPQVFKIAEPYMRRALGGEAMMGVEIQKPAANPPGEASFLLASYQPVVDEAGEILGISVAITDITQHKRAEEALREVEAHYRTLLDVGSNVPWVLNLRGEVVEAGKRWEALTGQPLADAMGTGWLRALHPDDVPPTQEAIRTALLTGGAIDIRYRVRNGTGAWKWMRSRGSPRLSKAGKIIGFYGVVEELPVEEAKGLVS